MRVLHVYSGNLYGGIETLLATFARRRGESEIEPVFALCFEGRLASELRAAGAAVHGLGEVRASRPHTIRRARRALAELLRSGRSDRVICHAAWAQAMFAATVRRAGVPLVFWAHDALAGKHWTERWARRVPPDVAICNSEYTKRSVEAFYPGVPAPIVRYPVDIVTPAPGEDARNALRAELTTPSDAVVIVQVSRMEAWKGHEIVLEALGRLRDRDGWIWWIVGGAQRPAEAAYARTLVGAAARLGIADRVRFVGERRDVPRLLAAADIHCQANLRPEPFGIALVEALGAGLPVVAAAAGGPTEIVDDSCGVLVTPGDRQALAAALERLIADRPYRARLAAAAPARARSLTDPTMQLRRLSECLAGIGVPAAV